VATGTISITVADGTGAMIPGASATVTNNGTGLVRSGTSNERGELSVQYLPVGQYSISVQIAGFKKTTIEQLVLQVDQTASIRVTLQPGEVREVIEVKEVSSQLEAETSSLGQVIENKKILELPLNGRNAFALGLLSGNTTPMFGMGSNLPFIAGGGRFSANEVTLDGVDNNTVSNAGSIGRNGIALTPSVDAVQEFKVKTSTFSAEYGHAAGAVIKHTRDAGMARQATLGCGLHPHTPAYDVQRACGTSLSTVVQIAQRIESGEIECGIAGGVEYVFESTMASTRSATSFRTTFH
jgi:hypothetical protein